MMDHNNSEGTVFHLFDPQPLPVEHGIRNIIVDGSEHSGGNTSCAPSPPPWKQDLVSGLPQSKGKIFSASASLGLNQVAFAK